MGDIRIHLTDKSISELKPPVSGQYRARDTLLKGFYVVVGKRKKVFAIQGDLRDAPQHLDLKRRVLHILRPKDGADRAFDIPLSRQMILCLMRLIRFARYLFPQEAEDWLFPAESESGHLAEQKEDREILEKWGNELRQTFRTLAAPAGVSPARRASPDEPRHSGIECRLHLSAQAT